MSCWNCHNYQTPSKTEEISLERVFEQARDTEDTSQTETVLYEGVVFKMNLGASKEQLIEKWVRLTTQNLHIFKSRIYDLTIGKPTESFYLPSLSGMRTHKNEAKFYLEIEVNRRSYTHKLPMFFDPNPKKVTVPAVNAVLKSNRPKASNSLVRKKKHTWTFRENSFFRNQNKIVLVFDKEEKFRDFFAVFEQAINLA